MSRNHSSITKEAPYPLALAQRAPTYGATVRSPEHKWQHKLEYQGRRTPSPITIAGHTKPKATLLSPFRSHKPNDNQKGTKLTRRCLQEGNNAMVLWPLDLASQTMGFTQSQRWRWAPKITPPRREKTLKYVAIIDTDNIKKIFRLGTCHLPSHIH